MKLFIRYRDVCGLYEHWITSITVNDVSTDLVASSDLINYDHPVLLELRLLYAEALFTFGEVFYSLL